MANERLQGEEQQVLSFGNVSFPCQNAFKRAPQNLNFTMAKAISISYNLDCSSKCPCTFPQSYVWSHSLVFEKSHFKTSNILFRKNY